MAEKITTSRDKIKAVFSFLKEVDPVDCEQRAYACSSSPSQEGSRNGVSESSRSVSRPWDRAAFMDRVHSFSSLSWFAKPAWLSPLHCARYGWKNVETDLLQCVSCKAYFSGRMPAIFDSQVYEEQCQGMEEALRVAHDPCCPWMNNPSPESFLRLPPIKQSAARAEYTANIRKLLEFGKRLPLFEASMLEELNLSEVMLQKLVNIGARDVAEENQTILHSACVLALCGWRADSWGTGSEKVSCNCCKRTLGLWNHVPCDPEFTQDLESSGEDESESNIDGSEVPMETENGAAISSEINGIQEPNYPEALSVVPSEDTAESISESVRETVEDIMDRVSQEALEGQSMTAFIKTEEGDVIARESKSPIQTAEEGGDLASNEIQIKKEHNDATGDQSRPVGDYITTDQTEGSSELKKETVQSPDITQVKEGHLDSDDSQTTNSEGIEDPVQADIEEPQNILPSEVSLDPEATSSTKEIVTQILNQILEGIPSSQSVANEALEYADVASFREQSPSAQNAPDQSGTGTQYNQSEDSSQVQDTPISIRSSFEFPDFEMPTSDIDNPPRGQQEKTTTDSHPLETPEISEMTSENPFSELSASGANLPIEDNNEGNIFDMEEPQANFDMCETDLSYSVQADDANVLSQDRLNIADPEGQNIADMFSAVKQEPTSEPSDFTTFIESQISPEESDIERLEGEKMATVQSPSSDHMTSELSYHVTSEPSHVNREMTSDIPAACESDQLPSEPPRKKRRRKRFEPVPFHPLSEHRAWCQWSTVHQPTRLSVSSSQSEDSLQEPGWKYLLRILTTNMSPQASKIVNIVRTTPPREGLKSIRKLFDRWTSPLVQSDNVS